MNLISTYFLLILVEPKYLLSSANWNYLLLRLAIRILMSNTPGYDVFPDNAFM